MEISKCTTNISKLKKTYLNGDIYRRVFIQVEQVCCLNIYLLSNVFKKDLALLRS